MLYYCTKHTIDRQKKNLKYQIFLRDPNEHKHSQIQILFLKDYIN